MQKIPEHLRIDDKVDTIWDWCLVRYQKGNGMCCGPLSLHGGSPDVLGFPGGYIGPEVLTFETPQKAQKFLDDNPRLGGAVDKVQRVDSLEFLVSVFNSYDCTTKVIYRGSDLLEVRKVYFAQVGRIQLIGFSYRNVQISLVTDSKPKENSDE